MVESKITRRSFVQAGLMSLLAVRAVGSVGTLRERRELEVALEARGKNPGVETVSFGLPLPPGFLSDTRRVRLVDDSGQELAAAVPQKGISRLTFLVQLGFIVGAVPLVSMVYGMIKGATDYTVRR